MALLALAARADAQQRPPIVAPEPRLYDTPWGDFPLERVLPGARLRLQPVAGRTTEVWLAALHDSTLDLRPTNGAPASVLTFADLRRMRRVDVRAIPRWRERAGYIGFVTGAVAGGLAGAAQYKNGRTLFGVRTESGRGEEMAASAVVVGFAGWLTGRLYVGRARWRPVAVP